MKSDLIDVEVTIVHQTEKAYLIDHGGRENVWVPKSQVEYDDNDGTMAMPRSLAEEKGII